MRLPGRQSDDVSPAFASVDSSLPRW